jgi:hypothetical protein
MPVPAVWHAAYICVVASGTERELLCGIGEQRLWHVSVQLLVTTAQQAKLQGLCA